MALLLGSDVSRCAFLRSEPFNLIRLYAIYRKNIASPPSPCWGPNGLVVDVHNKMIRVQIVTDSEDCYDSSWAGPVVYDLFPGYDGQFDAYAKTEGPFLPGKRAREAREDDLDELV